MTVDSKNQELLDQFETERTQAGQDSNTAQDQVGSETCWGTCDVFHRADPLDPAQDNVDAQVQAEIEEVIKQHSLDGGKAKAAADAVAQELAKLKSASDKVRVKRLHVYACKRQERDVENSASMCYS